MVLVIYAEGGAIGGVGLTDSDLIGGVVSATRSSTGNNAGKTNIKDSN